MHHSNRTKHELVFSFAAIDYLVHRIIAHEAAWQEFFACAGIQPLTVGYEELECAYEETAATILRYLHVPLPQHLTFAPPSMQRQADELSEQWVQRYCMIKEEYAMLMQLPQHSQPVEA